MNENVQFAIPSHARPYMVRDYTLAMLDRLEVPRDQISVFVSEDQLWSYQEARLGVEIRKGAPRLVGNRNFIATAFPSGTPVVSIDDDIKRLVYVPGTAGGRKAFVLDADGFKVLVEKGIESLYRWQAAIWGLNRTTQGLFLGNAPEIHVGLPTLEGNFYGFISGMTDLEVPDVSDSGFEDLERPLKVFAAGWNVVRFSRVGYVKYGGTAGGRARAKNACDDALRIIRAYPKWTSHGVGKSKTQSKCKPVIRRGMMVANPASLFYVDAMRTRAEFNLPPNLPDEPHEEGWE